MTDRKAQARRLERAGYVYLGGWVLDGSKAAETFAEVVETYRVEVARIAAEPPKPRGRPRKSTE